MSYLKKHKFKILSIILVVVLAFSVYIFYGKDMVRPTSKPSDEEKSSTFSEESINESIQKLADIYDKKNEYFDKEITITLQYLKNESTKLDDKFLVGIKDVEFKGKKTSLNILASYHDKDFINNLKDLEWIGIKGVIKAFKEKHGDHFHEYPIIEIEEIKVISKD